MGIQKQINNRIGNSVDPDEKAHCKSSHMDLHFLQTYFVLVYRAERVKPGFVNAQLAHLVLSH